MCDFAYTDAEADKRYAYKVAAVNAAGESPESEIFSFGLQLAIGDDSEPENFGDVPGLGSSGSSEPQPEQGGTQSSKTVVMIAVFLAVAAAALFTGILVRKRSGKQ